MIPSERDDIPYLPPVELLPGELVDVHKEVTNVDTLANLDGLGEVPGAVLEHAEQVAPDACPLLLIQPVIAQGEVDAALNRRVAPGSPRCSRQSGSCLSQALYVKG